VSGQVTTDDVALIDAMGFRSLICNRPDGEALDQPLFEAIRTVAKRAHIETAYLPVKTETPTDAEVDRMRELFNRLPKPVLAYCRTGARSAALLGRIADA
jgi:uncharacterized protein (TIGR01244 family)